MVPSSRTRRRLSARFVSSAAFRSDTSAVMLFVSFCKSANPRKISCLQLSRSSSSRLPLRFSFLRPIPSASFANCTALVIRLTAARTSLTAPHADGTSSSRSHSAAAEKERRRRCLLGGRAEESSSSSLSSLSSSEGRRSRRFRAMACPSTSSARTVVSAGRTTSRPVIVLRSRDERSPSALAAAAWPSFGILSWSSWSWSGPP
mmetsp:Transcript_20519/g.42726  ORF Transcript_20519/g.42726 Transcript_20519/m.42726 type:complete len:204 (-) Transcript_20519:246-857(-)